MTPEQVCKKKVMYETLGIARLAQPKHKAYECPVCGKFHTTTTGNGVQGFKIYKRYDTAPDRAKRKQR